MKSLARLLLCNEHMLLGLLAGVLTVFGLMLSSVMAPEAWAVDSGITDVGGNAIYYELTDVNGQQIGNGYMGDADVLQQGLYFSLRAWEYTGNASYEEDVAKYNMEKPYGPLYAFYYYKVIVTCVDDGSTTAKCGAHTGCGFFGAEGIHTEINNLTYGNGWITRYFAPTGVFIGGRSYTVFLEFGREVDDLFAASTDKVVVGSLSFTIGTDPCDHEHTQVVGAKDATCVEDGYTGDVVCADCGEVVQEGEVIQALGHDAQWVVVREATEDSDGLEQLVCQRDGDVLDERVIPKTGSGDAPDQPSDDQPTGQDPGGGSTDDGDGSNGSGNNSASGDPNASDDSRSSGGSSDGKTSNGANDGGDGQSDDTHDRKAPAGVGNAGVPDSESGDGQAGAAADSGSSPGASGGPAGASTASAAAAAGEKAQDGADVKTTEAGATGDELLSFGNVYRVGRSGSGDEADETELASAAAQAIDFTVTGLPLVWVLMWSSLPGAFAVGLGRRAIRNAAGLRRASRLAGISDASDEHESVGLQPLGER